MHRKYMYVCMYVCTYVYMYVLVCVYPRYVIHARTVTFNVDDHFHLETIININVIIHVILKEGQADSIEEIQAK